MGRSPTGSIDKVGKYSYRLRRYIDGCWRPDNPLRDQLLLPDFTYMQIPYM